MGRRHLVRQLLDMDDRSRGVRGPARSLVEYDFVQAKSGELRMPFHTRVVYHQKKPSFKGRTLHPRARLRDAGMI
jgi:hypothetical protein